MALPNPAAAVDKKTQASNDQLLKLTQEMLKLLDVIAEATDVAADEQEVIEEQTSKTAKIEAAMLRIKKLEVTKNIAKTLWQRKVNQALIKREKQKFNMMIRQSASLSHIEQHLTGFSEGIVGLPAILDTNMRGITSQIGDFTLKVAGGFGLMRKAGETAAKWTKGGFNKLFGQGEKRAKKEEEGKLKAVENDRENRRFWGKMLDALGSIKGEKGKKEDNIWGKLFQAVVLLGTFLMAWFAGLFTELDNQLLALRAWIRQTWVGKLVLRLKKIQKLGIGGLVTRILAPFEKIILWIKGKWLKATEGISTMWTKLTTNLTKWFPKLSKIINPILGIGPRLLGLLAKVAWPLTILLMAWEAIKGFMKGWEKYATGGFWDGVMGGILGAFEGILRFFTDDLLNLAKDVVAWLLGKFGWTDLETKLDSFEFNISGIVTGWLTSAINWIYGLFGLTPLGVPAEGTFPEDEDWTLSGMLNSVWEGIKDWFLDMINWKKVRAEMMAGKATNADGTKINGMGDIIMYFIDQFVNWFSEFLSFDFGKVQEWFFTKMGSMGDTLRGWLGGDTDEAGKTKGISPSETQGLLDKVNSYADRIMTQHDLINGLQKQINELTAAYDNARATAGGGAIAVTNSSGGTVTQVAMQGTPNVRNTAAMNGDVK